MDDKKEEPIVPATMATGLRKRVNNNNSNIQTTTTTSCTLPSSSEESSEQSSLPSSLSSSSTSQTNIQSKKKNDKNDNHDRRRKKQVLFSLLPIILLILFHMICLFIFIVGFILRISFHTGSECDMTYSMRIFVEIETPPTSFPSSSSSPSSLNNYYKLYKFVDRRDPRYQSILKQSSYGEKPLTLDDESDDSQNWCYGTTKEATNTKTTKQIVLYIPGHWGSYSQSRSIGAHGTTLTRQQQSNVQNIQHALFSNELNGSGLQSLENFVFDVYSVDFNEQGGALHCEFLLQQSDYVASIINYLHNECSTSSSSSSIILVGHSMGGIVARLAMARHFFPPSTIGNNNVVVKNIITLATPHSNPLYAFDKSIYDVYQLLEQLERQQQQQQQQETSSLLLVSISGGLRDEMIESTSTTLLTTKSKSSESSSSTLQVVSVLAPELLLLSTTTNDDGRRGGSFGMDHRAIVWCHGILEQVRKVIWSIAKDEYYYEEQQQQDIDNNNEKNDNNNDDDVRMTATTRRRQKVEEILQVGEKSDDEVGQQQHSSSFWKDNEKMHDKFYSTYGFSRVLCMESAMLYNLPLLLGIYSIIGCLRFALIIDNTTTTTTTATTTIVVVPLIIAIGSAMTFCGEISKPVSIVLCCVANTIHICLSWIVTIGFMKEESKKKEKQQSIHTIYYLLLSLVGLFMFVQMLAFTYSRIVLGEFHPQPIDCVLYIFCIALVYWVLVVCLAEFGIAKKQTSNAISFFGYRIAAYTALVALTIPTSLAGSIALMVWEESTRVESWMTLLSSSLIPVGMICLSNVIQQRRRRLQKKKMMTAVVPDPNDDNDHDDSDSFFHRCLGNNNKIRSVMMILSVLLFSPWILSRGNAFQVPRLIFTISLVEIGTSFMGKFLS